MQSIHEHHCAVAFNVIKTNVHFGARLFLNCSDYFWAIFANVDDHSTFVVSSNGWGADDGDVDVQSTLSRFSPLATRCVDHAMVFDISLAVFSALHVFSVFNTQNQHR